MKEFDFDELDKAVSSLMGEVPSTPNSDAAVTEPAQDAPVADSQALPETPATTTEAEQVPEERPSSLPQPSDAPATPLAARPPATKRAGRFMDVVHPSSDMKNSSAKPSREGITITPPSTQSPDEPVETPAQPEPEAAAKPEVTETSDISNNETAESEPLTTPFLPDAKVEKRPLGSAGPSLDEQMAHELSGRSDSISTSETAQSTPASTPKAEEKLPVESAASDENTSTTIDDKQQPAKAEVAVLPPELGEELVAIESGDKTTPMSGDAVGTKPEPTASNEESITKPTASSQGSITQQYTEQPSSSDASHAAIFDTATDHPPLTHPKKHHSGWLWVLVVVVLLAIGAAGGSAIYFFELI